MVTVWAACLQRYRTSSTLRHLWWRQHPLVTCHRSWLRRVIVTPLATIWRQSSATLRWLESQRSGTQSRPTSTTPYSSQYPLNIHSHSVIYRYIDALIIALYTYLPLSLLRTICHFQHQIFTARRYSRVAVCLFIYTCLSVCQPQVGVLPKRLNVESRKHAIRFIAEGSSFLMPKSLAKFQCGYPNGAPNTGWAG